MTPDQVRAEAHRLGDALTVWTLRYPRSSRTYRQFWEDYAAASVGFEALMALPGLPDDVLDAGMIVRDLPIQLGLEPQAFNPPRSPDKIIRIGE